METWENNRSRHVKLDSSNHWQDKKEFVDKAWKWFVIADIEREQSFPKKLLAHMLGQTHNVQMGGWGYSSSSFFLFLYCRFPI